MTEPFPFSELQVAGSLGITTLFIRGNPGTQSSSGFRLFKGLAAGTTHGRIISQKWRWMSHSSKTEPHGFLVALGGEGTLQQLIRRPHESFWSLSEWLHPSTLPSIVFIGKSSHLGRSGKQPAMPGLLGGKVGGGNFTESTSALCCSEYFLCEL